MPPPTPGPWRHYRAPLRPALSPVIVNEVQAPRSVVVKWAGFDESSVSQRRHAANAAFIAAARNAMPRLLAMIDAERAEVARLREAARGQIVVVETARQMQAQVERDLAAARMALETRPCATDLAAANYRAKTAERERDEARVENARLRVFADFVAWVARSDVLNFAEKGSIIAAHPTVRAALKGGDADA